MFKRRKLEADDQRIRDLEVWNDFARMGCYRDLDLEDDQVQECPHSYLTQKQFEQMQEDVKRYWGIPLEMSGFGSNIDVVRASENKFFEKWMPCILAEERVTGRRLRPRFITKED